MRLGLVADLHGNTGALNIALERLDGRVDRMLMAGDALNQYRFEDEIIETIRKRGIVYITGNHEHAMLGNMSLIKRLRAASEGNWEFLSQAPDRVVLELDGKRLLMVHGSPWPPHDEYLYENDQKLQRVPELEVDFLVLGHTHVPMILTIGSTLVVNPGSVGDARGGGNDGALSYAILDTDSASVTLESFDDPTLPLRAGVTR
jgi:putative phosphoesterase